MIAAWLLAAVELTSLAIKRLPKRVWRSIHLTSYAVFWLTSIHAALAGTDRANSLYQLTAAASIIAVAWALTYRLTARRARNRPTPPSNRSPDRKATLMELNDLLRKPRHPLVATRPSHRRQDHRTMTVPRSDAASSAASSRSPRNGGEDAG